MPIPDHGSPMHLGRLARHRARRHLHRSHRSEVPRPRAAHALRRDARRRDADRRRQEPRAVLAGCRGRPPDRRGPARHRQALRGSVARRMGSGRALGRSGSRRRRRRSDLPVGRHVALQRPRHRLPARVLRRVQPVDRGVLRDGARTAHRHGPDRVAHAGRRHRRPRVDQGARAARRDAAGAAAPRPTTTTRCTTSSGTRSSISGSRRRSTSSRARTTSRSARCAVRASTRS